MNTSSFTFRLPDDLREKLQQIADKEGRSLSNMIIYLLKKGVESVDIRKQLAECQDQAGSGDCAFRPLCLQVL